MRARPWRVAVVARRFDLARFEGAGAMTAAVPMLTVRRRSLHVRPRAGVACVVYVCWSWVARALLYRGRPISGSV
eukprot:8882426-Lingulodinium_polyedra.AAC.1